MKRPKKIAFIVAAGNLAMFFLFACMILSGKSNELNIEMLAKDGGVLGRFFFFWFVPELAAVKLTILNEKRHSHFNEVFVFWAMFRILCLFGFYFVFDWLEQKKKSEEFSLFVEQSRKQIFLTFIRKCLLILAFFNVLITMFAIGTTVFQNVFGRIPSPCRYWFAPEFLLTFWTDGNSFASFARVLFFWVTVKMVFLFALYFLLDFHLRTVEKRSGGAES